MADAKSGAVEMVDWRPARAKVAGPIYLVLAYHDFDVGCQIVYIGLDLARAKAAQDEPIFGGVRFDCGTLYRIDPETFRTEWWNGGDAWLPAAVGADGRRG